MSISLNITSFIWTNLKEQFREEIVKINDKEIFLVRGSKNLLNQLYRGFIGVVMLIYMIATPFFILIDCCFPYGKPLHKNVRNLSEEKIMTPISILDFYQGGKNDQGVSLEDICTRWNHSDLEQNHLFIQWLFPSLRKGVNPTCPCTNKKTIMAFRGNKDLQGKMLKAFKVMLDFYGFVLKSDETIVKSPNFSQRSKHLFKHTHNFFRITRILKSLRLHGLEKYATAFYNVLKEYRKEPGQSISDETLAHWLQAMKPYKTLAELISHIEPNSD